MGRNWQLFNSMTGRWAWAFMVILPAIWIVFAAVGWTRDDYVEDSVEAIWTRSGGAYYQDKEYRASLTEDEEQNPSSFLAMAISRDGKNSFTSSRLEEIRTRMEEAENTTIEYNGVTYSWDDVCFSNNAGLGTTYQFPCLRLSPMDLFQEARWFFDETDRVTWYQEIIRKLLVKPRIPRFGVMQEVCTTTGSRSVGGFCDEVLLLRTNEMYAQAKGYPEGYANPLELFSDIGNLELNDPCRICYDEGYETLMEDMTAATKGIFGIMALELNKYFNVLMADNSTNSQDLAIVGGMLQTAVSISSKLDRAAVEEFYAYYVTRGLYIQLGAEAYAEGYAGIMAELGPVCDALTGSSCPRTVSLAEAAAALTAHADNEFSSITTAGSPLPFWGNGNGTGAMFAGNSPVSGSGIDLSGTLLSSAAYFNITHYNTTDWSPLYSEVPDILQQPSVWSLAVETDPVFRWFMAGETNLTSSCGNGNLLGTATGNETIDTQTAGAAAFFLTERWCTRYNTPFEDDGTETEQHFAKMWYDLVVDSDSFLGITQGESDPYVWTSGQGCDYELKGMRYPYTGDTDDYIKSNASRELYYIDEGVSVGALDRNLLIGDVTPSVQEYNYTNPIQHVGVTQTIYVTGTINDIQNRVKNCNRPGGPVNITLEDAEKILEEWKIAFEKSWTRDWNNDDAGEMQFVGFYDDQGGAPGTFSQLLGDITLDNGRLMAISIILIAVLSAAFLFSCDPVESRVLITLWGVGLVVLSFFAAIGFGILVGIKININIAWTLPFIIIGLGVDDMYIVTLALKKRRSYTKRDFVIAMKDVVVPVTMTSLVNASMFAVMNVTDIQAIYKTAQVALISVIFLYLTIIFCFPAYCYLDMRRQQADRYDVVICKKKGEQRGKRNRFGCRKTQADEEEVEEGDYNDGDDAQEPSTPGGLYVVRKQGKGEAEDESESASEVQAVSVSDKNESDLESEEVSGDDETDGAEAAKKTKFEELQARFDEDPDTVLYDKVYKPLVFGDGLIAKANRIFICLATLALIGVGIWGITQRELGLGVEEFFPSDHQANKWATTRTKSLASWSVAVNWGALNYTDPDEQMRMVKQFEQIVATSHIAETDTKQLWMADFLIWTSRQCAENFDRDDPEVKACGRDQVFPEDSSTCSGTWRENIYDLREKAFDDPTSNKTCSPFEGGICRPTSQMHFADIMEVGITTDSSWCPVFEGWSENKMKFCVEQWRDITGGGGNLIVEKDTATPYADCPGEFHNDDSVRVPIPFSQSPSMFAYDLFSHEATVDLIRETRAVCDNNETLHCWMTGIPFDYWEQYLWVEGLLLEIAGICIAVGFGVAWLFLFSQIYSEGFHKISKIVKASLVGSLLIALTCAVTLVIVVGLSSLFDVNFTAFGMMAFVLSVGFSVEYSCHVVHRWLTAPLMTKSAKARVEYAMQFLTLPLTLSFVSSTIGVACLAFTEFEFNQNYFFRPLIIVMFVSYFIGCWALPVLLMWLDCDFMKVGKPVSSSIFHADGLPDEDAEMQQALEAAELADTEMPDSSELIMKRKDPPEKAPSEEDEGELEA